MQEQLMLWKTYIGGTLRRVYDSMSALLECCFELVFR